MTHLRGSALLMALMLAACGTQAQNAAAETRREASNAESVEANSADNDAAPVTNDHAPSSGGYTIDRSNVGVVGVLKDIFVRAGTIDGKPIRDFRLVTRCETAFVTDNGTITIDWSHVGNYAGRLGAGRETFPIDDGKGVHVIGVPSGHHAEPLGDSGPRTDSGLGSLADGCAR